MEFDPLSRKVIGCAIEVHRQTGPGLLESCYEACLAQELSLHEIPFERQWPLPIEYKGLNLDAGYRVDLLVEKKIIVEIKSVSAMVPIFEAQLLTYMKLSKIPIGLLINFNVVQLKFGIKRMVL